MPFLNVSIFSEKYSVRQLPADMVLSGTQSGYKGLRLVYEEINIKKVFNDAVNISKPDAYLPRLSTWLK